MPRRNWPRSMSRRTYDRIYGPGGVYGPPLIYRDPHEKSFAIQEIKEIMIELLLRRYHYLDKPIAIQMYTEMIESFKAYYATHENLLKDTAGLSKEDFKRMMDGFTLQFDNWRIFRVFSREPNLEEVFVTLCKFAVQNFYEASDEIIEQPIPIKDMTFTLRSKDDDEGPVWEGDVKSLLKMGQTGTTDETLKFDTFLEQAQKSTSFDPQQHMLYFYKRCKGHLIPDSDRVWGEQVISSEVLWKLHLGLENETVFSELRFKYAKPKKLVPMEFGPKSKKRRLIEGESHYEEETKTLKESMAEHLLRMQNNSPPLPKTKDIIRKCFSNES